ncbi:hypothetical protein BUALT_Bualt10G0070900 [Buddleja alternifolia]|uniref:Uncharacterized protein n=1 Tax=Buddleja alternifolia TaxID=168488 RepID=A0AAV6X4V6_9LAMI|nr:hypothetical protein BUALT_Bualt10G0070900 [Buddleja alternifolia]
MASEGFESFDEWDADLLDQLVQAEERALSTQLPHHHHPPPPQPPPQCDVIYSPLPPQPPPQCDVSYSPPRELSQRAAETSHTGGIPDCFDSFAPRETHYAKEQEIDRLKEQECSELRKERHKKEEQLKVVHSRTEAKDAECLHTRNTDSDRLVSSATAPGTSGVCLNEDSSNNRLGTWTKSYNTVGVQTDKTTEPSTSDVKHPYWGSEKLLALWNSNEKKQGRVLVAKLFMICEADFQVLFGYLNSSFPCKAKLGSPQNDSDMTLSDQPPYTQPVEAAKVSQLYSVLTKHSIIFSHAYCQSVFSHVHLLPVKISNETSRLEDLLEALVDLCSLKNVVIIHKSLRVLRMILSNSINMEKEFSKRENVMVEEPFSKNSKSDINGCTNSEKESLLFANVAEMLKQGQIPFELKLSDVKPPGCSGLLNHRFTACVSGDYWVSLFENICRIAIKNNDKQIRHEAVSIMNLILMRQNAYLERDKFVGELVFQSLSQLLRKEAGFFVQDQAVHTLYLLCNCPKATAMLCSGLKEDGDHACSNDYNGKSISTFQGLNEILVGLADCVACCGSATVEEMKLRRNAIVFLAFLGSSGKSGFEILLNHRLPKGTNFLAIILQSLISDLDLQQSKSAHQSSVIREQSLLIREALILLNRLVSHPQYSVHVLQALTNTRDMASTTVEVANRLTRKSKLLWQDDNTMKQVRESEIVDLARVFKKRVFTFLGDSIS